LNSRIFKIRKNNKPIQKFVLKIVNSKLTHSLDVFKSFDVFDIYEQTLNGSSRTALTNWLKN